MKKLRYTLPLIGLLFFISCDNDPSDEIIDETLALDESQIEIIENTDNKGLNLNIAPGLYGPNETTPFTNAKYTLILSQNILNQIPETDQKYRIHIYYQQYNTSSNSNQWISALITDVPSNRVTLKFPANYNGSRRYKWLVGYFIMNGNSIVKDEYKEVTINHN